MGAYQPHKPEQRFELNLSSRGYVVLFRPDEQNHCPGCGHSQWYIGRISAECGICGTALPLAADAQQSPVSGVASKAVALHIVGDKSPAAQGKERRREERIPAQGRTIGLYIDGSQHAFKLENISSGGAMGRVVPGMRGARSLMVELDDGRMMPAELRWCDGEFAGLAFLSDNQG